MSPRLSPAARKARPRTIVLLGVQRFNATLGSMVKELEVEGRFALITAGWQEEEAEDGELSEHLGGDTVNLRLHHRADDVFARDPELAQAHRERQELLRHKQDFYRIRLEHELAANHVIRQHKAPPALHAEEQGASLAAIRALDDYHLAQCERIHEEFEVAFRPHEREVVAQHRAEVEDILQTCAAVAIAGGHVASLINRLRLFGIAKLIEKHTIFAWSAAAMALSDRIVLFHDDPPQGAGASEVLDSGLGLVPGVVVLPQPEARLRLGDKERVSLLAGRFAPAASLAFPAGAHLTWRDSRLGRSSTVLRLLDDGSTVPFDEAHA